MNKSKSDKSRHLNNWLNALIIFHNYDNPRLKFKIVRNYIRIFGVDPDLVKEKDKVDLEKLGFSIDDSLGLPLFTFVGTYYEDRNLVEEVEYRCQNCKNAPLDQHPDSVVK